MLKKLFFASFLAFALVAFGNVAAFAQAGGVSGKVEMKNADGTVTPVQGARIDIFQTDIKRNKPYTTKTGKKGNFNLIGLLYGGKFVMSVSAPNATPSFSPINVGAENVVVTLNPGDGYVLTLEDIKAGGRKQPAETATTNTPTDNNPPPVAPTEPVKKENDKKRELSDEEIRKENEKIKKENAEYEKKKAAVDAQNAKIINAKNVYEPASKAGAEAFNAKDYDLAIAKYDEAYRAEPDYWGTAPVFLMNKALVYDKRGTEKYNAALRTADRTARSAQMKEAAKDFQEAVNTLNVGLEVLKKSAAPAPAETKSFSDKKYALLKNRTGSYSLLVRADASKAVESVPAYEEYIAIENDSAKKNTAQIELANNLFSGGEFEKAIPAYKLVLASNPSNPDALYNLASALIGLGGLDPQAAGNKVMIEEGVSYMEQFLKAAPSNYDQAKIDDAKGQIEVNNASLKAKPAVTKPGRKKN